MVFNSVAARDFHYFCGREFARFPLRNPFIRKSRLEPRAMLKDEGGRPAIGNSRHDAFHKSSDRTRPCFNAPPPRCVRHHDDMPFTVKTIHSRCINKVVQGRALPSCIYTEYVTTRNTRSTKQYRVVCVSVCTHRFVCRVHARDACVRVGTRRHVYRDLRAKATEPRYRSECVENAIDSLGRPVDLFSSRCV